MGRGVTGSECPKQTPTFLDTPQRLLQVTGRRQPEAGGQDRGEALRAFLNPRSGGCSWHEAHADMGHLVGTLGRDGGEGPPTWGNLSEGRGSPAVGLLGGNAAPPSGPEEDPGTSDLRPSPSQCVTLDELEAAPSEAALVERALELLSEPEDFPDSSQSPGPGHVRIKIRMDIDDVTRANKIRDRCGALWGRAEGMGMPGSIPPTIDLGRWSPRLLRPTGACGGRSLWCEGRGQGLGRCGLNSRLLG